MSQWEQHYTGLTINEALKATTKNKKRIGKQTQHKSFRFDSTRSGFEFLEQNHLMVEPKQSNALTTSSPLFKNLEKNQQDP